MLKPDDTVEPNVNDPGKKQTFAAGRQPSPADAMNGTPIIGNDGELETIWTSPSRRQRRACHAATITGRFRILR
jgi:hypothetical protein